MRMTQRIHLARPGWTTACGLVYSNNALEVATDVDRVSCRNCRQTVFGRRLRANR